MREADSTPEGSTPEGSAGGSEGTQAGALSGVRVISVGQILAAPYCATLLGEFGADVIKVERPGTGDVLRGGIAFAQDNRGKRSVTCDITSEAGRGLLRRLLDTADILVENFRPGTLERLSLAPESLRESNPGLIVVRISGYGQTGPYRDRAGFDRVALGFGGITAVTGEPGGAPVRPGYFIADYGAGTFAAMGALLALQARQRTGQGQDVDMALYEAVWRMSGTHIANYGRTGEDRPRTGNYYPGVVPAEQFETSDDEYLIVNATTDAVFARLAQAMGQPELAADARFARAEERRTHADAIHTIVRTWVSERTLAACQSTFDAHGVPAVKAYTTSDIAADPHYAAREQVLAVDSADFGTLLQPGIVPRLSATPGRVRSRAPRLGEHNAEVYGALGVSETELASLADDGVI